MLPGLMRERLDEFGIDFAVVIRHWALSFIHMTDSREDAARLVRSPQLS